MRLRGVDLTFRPMPADRVPPTRQRKRAQFRSGGTVTDGRYTAGRRVPLGATLDLLAAEAFHLDCFRVVLEVAASLREVRNDGMLRADARVSSPAVAVYLDGSRHGDLRYATDAFDDWRDNLRAVALGLEALRRVARYELGTGHEQYVGWTAIGSARTTLTRDEAARVLAAGVDGVTAADVAAADPEEVRSIYRRAAKKHHPDVGGSEAAWAGIDEARRVLGA
jgi:hypothetical protein